MPLHITRALPEHVPAVGRIFFESFDILSRRHGFTSEIFSPEFALGAATSLVTRPDIYGLVAVDGGEVIGHNFVQLTDAVAGVGPICVDGTRQCKGVGKALMTAIVDHALDNHGPQVRLYQEGFNMASLSLYTSLGFTVTDPVVIMSVPPINSPMPENDCRPLTLKDVDAADALCLSTQKVFRRNELAAMIATGPSMACTPLGRFRDGRLTGFVVPSFFGFGAGETPDDLLLPARVAASALPPPLQRIFLPTRNGDLMRAALSQGFRSLKVGQLMAMGPFEPPTGCWAPSVAY